MEPKGNHRERMPDGDDQFLRTTDDGTKRCWWASDHEDYQRYHDEEWGRPIADDIRLFEKICLEGFQSGLSWLTILRKRESFRKAFSGFDFHRVASFDDQDIARLLRNGDIVRHRGKIEATINNARRALEVVDEFGSLGAYVWTWEPRSPEQHVGKGDCSHPIPSITATSQLLSKDLKNRGWKFFGPTTAYAFMQAVGMVNDHVQGCSIRAEVEALRSTFKRPYQNRSGKTLSTPPSKSFPQQGQPGALPDGFGSFRSPPLSGEERSVRPGPPRQTLSWPAAAEETPEPR